MLHNLFKWAFYACEDCQMAAMFVEWFRDFVSNVHSFPWKHAVFGVVTLLLFFCVVLLMSLYVQEKGKRRG